jgi:PBP1b-binding outer membrane lipoprotein LpoB
MDFQRSKEDPVRLRIAPCAAMLLLAVVALAAGCATQARYIDPDARSIVEGTGIESRDMRAVASEMARDLIASDAINKFQGAPRLAVLPVKNRSRFLVDQEIITTLITNTLIKQGGGKLAILNRDLAAQVLKEREAKASGRVDGGAPERNVAGADFFLEGEIRSLTASTGDAVSDYVVVRFRLTDAETTVVA